MPGSNAFTCGAEGAFDMAHQLGLELTPQHKPIEMLVARKVE
jgi:hypothetical protein